MNSATTASGSRSSQARRYPSTQSASSMCPPPIVERDRARHRDVERLRAAVQRNRRRRGAGGDHLVGQTLPLGAQHEPARATARARRAAAPRGRAAPRTPPARTPEQRHAKDRAGRGPQRLGPERIRAPLREREVTAEGVRGARERSHVPGIAHLPQLEAQLRPRRAPAAAPGRRRSRAASGRASRPRPAACSPRAPPPAARAPAGALRRPARTRAPIHLRARPRPDPRLRRRRARGCSRRRRAPSLRTSFSRGLDAEVIRRAT